MARIEMSSHIRRMSLPDRSPSQISVDLGDGVAQCQVCPHHCTLRAGQIGRCRVRVGVPPEVRPIDAQAFAARGMGTVESHALFHFYPGMKTLCIGSIGCSAACRYCQNWELALAPRIADQWTIPAAFAPDADIVAIAKEANCGGLVFSYNEPTVWIEAMLDLAKHAQAVGLRVILVTNGFVTETALNLLIPYLDAVKLDLKGPDERFYREVVGIALAPVLATLEQLRTAGVWHEVSTVIVPGVNDSEFAIEQVAKHILRCSGSSTPWHLMRFFPAYRMLDLPPGDLDTLRRLRLTAQEQGITHVYISNVPNIPEQQSYCSSCGSITAVRRPDRFMPLPQRCSMCRTPIAGRGLC